MNDAHITRLLDHIDTLTRAGGDYNRVTMIAGEYHAIVSSARGRDSVTVELVGNRDLSRAARLTEGRAAVIDGHGFRRATRRPGPSKTYKVATEDERAALGRELADIFARAFGVDAGDAVELAVSLGDAERTRNAELIRAMRRVAQRRDNDSRMQLYRELARATYLLPLAESRDSDEPLVFETLRDRPVFGVFTDWPALRLWRPRGWPYLIKSADEVFALADAQRVGSLLINPRGNVGGELYMHEVEMIHRALLKLRARGSEP
ncbi:MAG: SseB family protein [Myxococcales bacterium]|nr:SseB family protein [Myxococcales bacterium]MCB9748915.1 SseB family protein [Myxococcales bacterium]